jgi:hypothetical protein
MSIAPWSAHRGIRSSLAAARSVAGGELGIPARAVVRETPHVRQGRVDQPAPDLGHHPASRGEALSVPPGAS